MTRYIPEWVWLPCALTLFVGFVIMMIHTVAGVVILGSAALIPVVYAVMDDSDEPCIKGEMKK